MDTAEFNSIEDVVNTLTEAIEFFRNVDRDYLSQFMYLFDDVKYGLEVVKKSSLFEDNRTGLEYTDQFIKIIDLYIQNVEAIDFTLIADAFLNWKSALLFDIAEVSFNRSDYTLANRHYNTLINSNNTDYRAVAFHRLGQIHSESAPFKALDMYKRAFEINNSVSKHLLTSDHPSYHYIYKEVEENYVEHCPFCLKEAEPHFCAESYRGLSYNKIYSPVKVWMYCDSCDHIFAYNNPDSLSDLKFDGVNGVTMPFKFSFLPTIGENLKRIKSLAVGDKLLDVGVGGGELLATAKELLFDVEGVEIFKHQANHVSELLGIKVYSCDFLNYETDKQYDIITMGDVIEHIEDPIRVIQKSHELLNAQGILWISTPNFHSAFSQFSKFNDPMWIESGHLQYFSYDSIKKLLERYGFHVVDYSSSRHYRGSMEVTAIKKTAK
ncbi:class I SAM-dependent methyltransferase [Paenibacillus brevis]|uniref:Class I SAM-dependent methyltransferase n=1 Tax=Paenibacillus brevis TaxID=2841508 RepID=A0ABS6FL81_9BACL|nr:class I SAM-dependent methyltransferase [Paenibacillus brevis]MBU5670962.1 class I SAM-dependent methyltransferase [Paenibacillus brevis]